MIVLLSPAKIQNYQPQSQVNDYSTPLFLSKSAHIISKLRKLSVSETADLLKVNFNIAEQVHDAHIKWNEEHTVNNSKQAAWVFNGEAYRGLDVKSFTVSDIEYGQNHFRILSGLYGILRPLDMMQPYRVDVGDELEQILKKSLYDFWKKDINNHLALTLKDLQEPPVILNLMSKEYSKLLNRKKLNAKIIDVDFLEYQPDKEIYKPIVVYIKKARGMMTRFVIQNRITNIEDLKAFSDEGYWFSEQLSTNDKMVFTR